MKIHKNDLKNEELIKGFINGLLSYQIIKARDVLNIELIEVEIITDIELIISNSLIDFTKANLLINLYSLAEFIIIYVAISFVKDNISENEYTDFVELDEENIEEFTIRIKDTLFKCIYTGNLNIKLDEDSRIFIDKIKRGIEDNKSGDNNKKYQAIITNSINMLNLILGVGK